MKKAVPFELLPSADLWIDRVYRGGPFNDVRDDPIAKLVPVGNQGGFRYSGSPRKQDVRLVVLYTTGSDPDWPDSIDPVTGDFTYYGDNKTPGSELHDTQRHGNALLRDIFAWSRIDQEHRRRVPPILLFERAGTGRDVLFRGLLAPGSPRLSAEDELVALWRTTRQHRFQNYRSHFTILREPVITRDWLTEILAGDPLGSHCPVSWRHWVQGRIYNPLEAPRTSLKRSVRDQYPDAAGLVMLSMLHDHFAPNPALFEHFAADIWLNSDPNVETVDVTRPSRDGGMDAVGTYRVGPPTDPVQITFALEAKCFKPQGSCVNVRMVSRLISRLRHRDFGVFVTTAHIGLQAYSEVRQDAHPVIFITGRDIIDILSTNLGIRTPEDLVEHLHVRYPVHNDLGSVDHHAIAAEVVVEPSTTDTDRVLPYSQDAPSLETRGRMGRAQSGSAQPPN